MPGSTGRCAVQPSHGILSFLQRKLGRYRPAIAVDYLEAEKCRRYFEAPRARLPRRAGPHARFLHVRHLAQRPCFSLPWIDQPQDLQRLARQRVLCARRPITQSPG